LRDSLDDLQDALQGTNDGHWRDTFYDAILAAVKVVDLHLNTVKLSVADDAANLRSTFQRCNVPREDPELGPLKSLTRLRGARAGTIADLDAVLGSAAKIGLRPADLSFTSSTEIQFDKAGIEKILAGLAARLLEVERGIEHLDRERDEDRQADVQQRHIIIFFIENMRVEISLAKLELTAKQILDFIALGRAIETMGELTRDFVATIKAVPQRFAEGVQAIAKEISKDVKSVTRGLRSIVHRAIKITNKAKSIYADKHRSTEDIAGTEGLETARNTKHNVALDYAVPPDEISEYITLLYEFSAETPVFEDRERGEHPQLRFYVSGKNLEYSFPDGSIQRPAAAHVIGPTSGVVSVRVEGPVKVFGLGLTMAGWSALVGNDALSMLNRSVDAEALFGVTRIQAVAATLGTASDIAGWVEIAKNFIKDLLLSNDAGAVQFIRHVDDWLVGSPSPDVEYLVKATGLSRRQVERKCNIIYGAPPKLLARKYRALRMAVAMTSNTDVLADLTDRGFYDQSHMIREVKYFTGLTPRQIRNKPAELAHLLLDHHPLLAQT